ncbi:uncharacterized protein LOC131606005 [Vicia villosa]|uniref:uncharacterized protein LOC131606005 n=1 Tax=Vicia villosa TaxID=3911 RepID=UPI00273C1956|nr:uncharacterized protein LOC131606005 [Vicia villosa]
MDPITYIFEKPTLTRRIARWQMLLSEYDVQYVTQKAIKESALSEYLSHQPMVDYQPMRFEFLHEDIMFLVAEKFIGDNERLKLGSQWKFTFGGYSNAMGHGIGVLLISPRDSYTPFTTRLYFECTNNMGEYKAYIMGIEAPIDIRIKILDV